MDARRRSLDITSRRFDLDGVEEVRVGAYARRVRRQRIALGAVGVALALAAWFIYHALTPDPAGGQSPRAIVLRCAACNADSQRTVAPDEIYPVACDKCGAFACRPLWQCRVPTCGERFLPPPTATVRHCPKCGSDQVGSAKP